MNTLENFAIAGKVRVEEVTADESYEVTNNYLWPSLFLIVYYLVCFANSFQMSDHQKLLLETGKLSCLQRDESG